MELEIYITENSDNQLEVEIDNSDFKFEGVPKTICDQIESRIEYKCFENITQIIEERANRI